MDEQLEAIEKQVGKRNFEAPPLHLWHPPLSGDIPIRIAADGTWYHEGRPIRRDSLVRLFSSVLKKEGKLTSFEVDIMHSHPERGARLVEVLKRAFP